MLATWNVLAVDGPSVGTSNVGTELGITNGTRCIVREVLPHPADDIGWDQAGHQPIVILSRPPICVWVEPISTNRLTYNFTSIEDHETWFPILPIDVQVTMENPTITFEQTQIPLTPGTQFLFLVLILIKRRVCIIRSPCSSNEHDKLHH
jgi:hypothetical protein